MHTLDSLDLAEVGAMDAEDIQDMLQKCMGFKPMLQKCMGFNEEDLIEFASECSTVVI